MQTTQTLYQNEIRAIQLRLTDQDELPFLPDSAYTTIYDSDGNVARDEQVIYINSNSVYDVVGTVVTGTVGDYEIIWKIVKDNYTYYHKTKLTVLSL